MNSTIEQLLCLQELDLLRRGAELRASPGASTGMGSLLGRIERVRRRIPGPALSQYDGLARLYVEPVAAVSHGCCQGCSKPLVARWLALLERSSQFQTCPHCRRFLYLEARAPDYVTAP